MAMAVVVGTQLVGWSCQRAGARVQAPAAPTAANSHALAPSTTTPPSAASGEKTPTAPTGDNPSRVLVQVTEAGFVPDHIPAQVGKPITLVITRKTDRTCAREILFKGQPGKTDLPLNKAVEATYTPKVSGAVPFGCSMGMMVGGALDVH
jgi:hypothetical protein